jgi:hypothetical protein
MVAQGWTQIVRPQQVPLAQNWRYMLDEQIEPAGQEGKHDVEAICRVEACRLVIVANAESQEAFEGRRLT